MAIIRRALVGLLGYGKSKNMCDFEKSPSVSGSLEAKKSKINRDFEKKIG